MSLTLLPSLSLFKFHSLSPTPLFHFLLWLEIEFEQVCCFPLLPAPLLHRYALCTVLIAWSWHHFPCHFSEIFSHPLLAAQVTCYFYSLRAGSLFVSVFASFQSGANNRGWQENRGNTIDLTYPLHTVNGIRRWWRPMCSLGLFKESLTMVIDTAFWKDDSLWVHNGSNRAETNLNT